MSSSARRVSAVRLLLTALLLFVVSSSLAAAEPKFRPVAGGIEGEYIVVLQSDVGGREVVGELARKHGAEVIAIWQHAVSGFWARMDAAAASAMSRDPRVRFIEQNVAMRESGSQSTVNGARPLDRDELTPSGHYFAENDEPLWHLTRLNNRRREQSVSAATYDYETDGAGVTIYVVDTGVLRFHQEFATPGAGPTPDHADPALHDRVRELRGSNQTNDPLPSSAPFNACTFPETGQLAYFDDPSVTIPYPSAPWFEHLLLSHGTACASVAAGRNMGVAPGATVVPVKVNDCQAQGSTAYFVSAFDWILGRQTEPRTPAVVTMSTYRTVEAACRTAEGNRCQPAPQGSTMDARYLLAFEEAVQRVVAAGIPVVVSANNNSRDACADTPARLSRSGGIRGWGAAGGGVISVGGLAKDSDTRWIGVDAANAASNYGPCVDLFAPAEDITVANTSAWNAYRTTLNSGTSFSAPMVAGLIARMFSDDAELRNMLDDGRHALVPDEVWRRLRESASTLPREAIRPAEDQSFANLTGTDLRIADATLASTTRRLAYMGAFSFVTQPRPVVKDSGVPLSVAAAGSGTTTYTWYRGESGDTSNPVKAASTDPTLCVGFGAGCVDPTENTRYWARATRNGMSADSAAATAVVNCPEITAQPASIWTRAGEPQQLAVTVLVPAGQTPSYQWYEGTRELDSTPIIGATGSTYTVTNPTVTSGYWVRVSVGTCRVDSDVALVRVTPCATPVITRFVQTAPPFGDLDATGSATLEVTAEPSADPPVLGYQWFRQEAGGNVLVREWVCAAGTNNCGETGPLVTAPSLTTPVPGRYFVRVWSNTCAYADSSVIEVRKCPNIAITAISPDTPLRNIHGTPRLIGVRATARNGANLTYQWYTQQNNAWQAIPGATASDYRVEPAITAVFLVVVSDGACSIASRPITVLTAGGASCSSAIGSNTVPPPAAINEGDVVTIHFREGAAVSKYEWWLGGSDAGSHVMENTCGATPCSSASYDPRVPGLYFLRIYQGGACRVSAGETMEDYGPFFINVCPNDYFPLSASSDYIGTNTPFRLTTTAYPDATYTWYEGFYEEATQIAQTLTNFVDLGPINEPKRYWVKVTMPCKPGGAKSRYVSLNPCGLPRRRAVAHPTTVQGSNMPFILSVEDDHDGTTFQWYAGTNYTDLSRPVGTGAAIQVSPTTTTTYWVRMTRTCGDTTHVTNSDFVTVNVACLVSLARLPQPATAIMPASGTVQVSTSALAAGNGGFTYEWYEGTQLVGTGPAFTWTYSVPAVAPDVVQKTLTLKVTSLTCAGSTTTQPVTLSIIKSPQRIYAYSAGGPLPEPGMVIELFVEMEPQASTDHVYSYRWFRDDGTAAGALIGETQRVNVTTYSRDSFWVEVTGRHKIQTPSGTLEYTQVSVSAKSYLSIYGECAMPPLRVTQSATSIDASSTNPEQVVFTAFCDWPGVTLQWYAGQRGDTRFPVSSDAGLPHQLTVGGIGDLPRAYWVRATMDCGASQDSPTLTYTKGGCEPVVFITQPQTVTVASGETVYVFADVADPTGKSYEWYEGEGETHFVNTGNPLVLPNMTASARYWVKVVDLECGTWANSQLTSVRVASCGSVNVSAWPAPVTWTDANQRATLTVNASGATGYQWYRGEVGDTSAMIGGATLATYQTDPLTADARYWVRVFGSGCAADSPTITVKVCDPPRFTSPITAMTNVVAGQATWIAVNAAGTKLKYQWYEGLPGDRTRPVGRAIHAYYTKPAQTTDYWVELTGQCGEGGADLRSLPSPKMTVSVCPVVASAPTATKQIVMPGTTTQLTLAPQGTRFHYQWYARTGASTVAIPNSDSATITTPPINADTEFFADVTSDVGGCLRRSPSILIALCKEPTIRWTSSAQNVAKNQPVWLYVDVVASQGANVTYYAGPVGDIDNSVVVSGPTVNRGVQVTPSATTTYWAMADNGAGCTAKTAGLTLTVCIPTFTTQPANASIKAGEQTTLRVQTDVAASLQWYAGDAGNTSQPVPNGTGTSITVAPASDTRYWVRATACGATVDSTAALVSVCQPPAITQLTQSVWITQGASIQLNVTASGTNLSYQWYRGNPGDVTNPIAQGAFTTVTPSNTTTYWVKVWNGCGSVNSNAIVISVCAKPVITTQPLATQTIFSGTTATLSVTATQSTTTPMTYQWYAGAAPGGTLIPNATASSYTTPPLTAPAQYWVKITAGNCSENSTTASVGICALPATVQGAPDAQLKVGQAVRLQVPTMSPVPEGYRWYQGQSGDISNALTGWRTDSTLDITPNVDTTYYWAEVKYGTCVSKTPTTTMRICVPTFTAHPASVMINSGQSTTLTAAANTTGVKYQWYIGSTGVTTAPVSGATQATYTTPALSSATNYWVRATGSCGATTDSATATVSICQPAAITAHPQNASIVLGAQATLTVAATGTELNYQWYQGAAGVTTTPVGTNSSSLTVAPSVPTSYWVRVTGRCGTANSSAATVNVCATPTISAQPQSQTIFSNARATLSVTASQQTGLAMSYQWYRGTAGSGTPISGATGSTYITDPITAQSSFWVLITSGSCTKSSDTATISLCSLPSTVSGAPNVQTTIGETVRLQVPVISPVPDQYRWYEGAAGNTSVPLTGWRTYGWIDVAPTTTKQYWAEVQKGSCISQTTTTTVSVCVPKITTQPASTMVAPNGSTTLSVAADMGVTYQWYTGTSGSGSPIPNATGSTYTTGALSATANYWVRVTSTSCSRTADSVTATVTVCSPPSITTQPSNTPPVYANQYTAVGVTATGTNLSYQWYRGERGVTTAPVGSNSATLELYPAGSYKYWVRVTGSCGTVDSNAVWVSVYPTISQQPASVSIPSGGKTTLTVVASGNDLHYQWLQGSTLVGTDSASFTTPALTASTSYRVIVKSGIAEVYSSTATVSMCVGPRIEQITPTYYEGCYRTVSVWVAYEDRGSASYQWYRGEIGDTSNPVSSSSSFSACVTETTKYWVRVSNATCYSDASILIYP